MKLMGIKNSAPAERFIKNFAPFWAGIHRS